QVLVIRMADSGTGRIAKQMRWGLVPSWTASPKSGPPLINARAETVEKKPVFRAAFKKRRCLVPADGFFEWKTQGKDKQAHYFTLKDGGLFAIAGLWERRESESGGILESVTLLTTVANALVLPCHERMPVILPKEAQSLWLDHSPGNDPAAL